MQVLTDSIVISLRNDMFELAHRLVGIYKTSNCTKSIAIDNKDLRTQARPAPAVPKGILRPGSAGAAAGAGAGASSSRPPGSPASRRDRTAGSVGFAPSATPVPSSQPPPTPSLSHLAPPGAMDAISSTPSPGRRQSYLEARRAKRRDSALSIVSTMDAENPETPETVRG